MKKKGLDFWLRWAVGIFVLNLVGLLGYIVWRDFHG